MVRESDRKKMSVVPGAKKKKPAEWFFKAHFYQDPVCPGSLGLESFIQLMKVCALHRWPETAKGGWRFENMVLGAKHNWLYRGQVVPNNKEVSVEAAITGADDDSKTLTAEGWLKVDGLPIYQMKDFSLRMVRM